MTQNKNKTLITSLEATRFIEARNAMLKAKADYEAVCKETSVSFQNQVLDALNEIECHEARQRLKAELLARHGESVNRIFPHA